MIRKSSERLKAIQLRQSGATYSEILSVIPVSKSTLSLWLHSSNLAQRQKQILSVKKKKAQLRGAARRKQQRVEETKRIYSMALNEVGVVSSRDLFILGCALYWAEGTKQRNYRPSVPIEFANSDPIMVRVFIIWAHKFLGVSTTDIKLILHIHEDHLNRLSTIERFWLAQTKLSRENLGSTVIKKHKPHTTRKNTQNDYNGLASIRIKRSTALNRRIAGWVHAIGHALI